MFSAKGCHDDPEHQFSHPFLQVKYESETMSSAVGMVLNWAWRSSWLQWGLNVGFSPLSGPPQAVGMFLGELSCLVVFYILICRDRRSPEPKMNPGQSFNPLLFFPPAMCDMTATSIMYVGKYLRKERGRDRPRTVYSFCCFGHVVVLLSPVVALNMTSASSFQMLRGAVIIFTGLLSVAFLGRRLAPSQWIGIFITILGLVIVGLADLFSGHNDSHKISDVITGLFSRPVLSGGTAPNPSSWCPLLPAGDLLIIMAQIIVSVQMVLEEKFVYKHDVHPLRAVGTEGTAAI